MLPVLRCQPAEANIYEYTRANVKSFFMEQPRDASNRKQMYRNRGKYSLTSRWAILGDY